VRRGGSVIMVMPCNRRGTALPSRRGSGRNGLDGSGELSHIRLPNSSSPESCTIPRKSPLSRPAPMSTPDFSAGDGLLPAIAQDAETGEVLMLAYMNRASYDETLATGRAVYFSRSRGRLWRKGEESGHVQEVQSILIDCDTILLKVRQLGGAACHEGFKSCFFRQVTPEGTRIIAERVFDPAKVYGKPE
jgi:phosphoribosyl-AMP cyclohydrolase